MNFNTITFFLFLSCISFKSIAQVNGLIGNGSESIQVIGDETCCDTIFSFPVLDEWPTGVAWDGSHLWSGGSDLDFIYKYDTDGVIIDSIPNPSTDYGTQGILFDGVNLWTLSEEQNRIFELDPNSGAVLNHFSIPFNNNGWGLTFIGEYLYATDYSKKQLVKIDPEDGEILNSFKTEAPLFGIEYINGSLYGVAYKQNKFYKIDETDGSFIDSTDWCIPYALGLTWDGSYLWNISSKKTFGGHQRMYKVDISSCLITSTTNILPQYDSGLKVFPNPLVESGMIQFNAMDNNLVTLDLLDLNGKKVKTLLDRAVKTGNNNIPFDSDRLTDGIYFLKLSSKNYTETLKFVINKS